MKRVRQHCRYGLGRHQRWTVDEAAGSRMPTADSLCEKPTCLYILVFALVYDVAPGAGGQADFPCVRSSVQLLFLFPLIISGPFFFVHPAYHLSTSSWASTDQLLPGLPDNCLSCTACWSQAGKKAVDSKYFIIPLILQGVCQIDFYGHSASAKLFILNMIWKIISITVP